MFDKNYKQAMDNITPSDAVKEKILDKLELKEAVARHKNPATPWRVAFACVASIAVILGALLIPQGVKKTSQSIQSAITPKPLTAAKSYNDVYKILKSKKVMAKLNGIFWYATDDMAIVEESDSETAMPNTAKPGAAAGDESNGDRVENIETYNSSNKDDFSGTTEQVEGVAEADIVKTDGKYIYYLTCDFGKQRVSIFSADKENSEFLGQIDLKSEESHCREMFLQGDRLIVLQNSYNTGMYARDMAYINDSCVTVLIYDVSNPKKPECVASVSQQGSYETARMIGDQIYLISNCNINLNDIDKEKPESFVPTTVVNDVIKPMPADKIYCYDEDLIDMPQYAVIGSYNFLDGKMTDSASILGGTSQIYCSQNNIILAKSVYHGIKENENYSTSSTEVSRLQINDGKIEYKASGKIDGTLDNQFFIDEYNGYFRFVTTANKAVKETIKFDNTFEEMVSYDTETSANLTVLDEQMKKVGEIVDLAPNERVYSVRFMGDTAYFVTFRQVDPLFSADLSDPKNPKIIGELKIPGFSEYMYPYGDGLLLGFGQDADETTGRTGDLKLSMFNIKDPANVTEDDVTVIDGYTYSAALYNHKEMLVSPTKNLIGFCAHDNRGNVDYLIYKYTNDAFIKVATLQVDMGQKFGARGIFINDAFYTINDARLDVYELETFKPIKGIEF